MANRLSREDPIQRTYYDPIEKSEKYLGRIFWASVVLSLSILLCDKAEFPRIYNALQILFCVAVILLFALDMFVRLYLKPRADDMRLKDFLSHAYGIALNHDQTQAYYNNNETVPIRKLAAQLLENAMHSKSTVLEMAKNTRTITLLYVLIFVAIAVNRSTNLEMISIAAQAIFGQHIVSTLLRIEWTRIRYERVYEDMYNLFLHNPIIETFEIRTIEGLTKYETTKANGGVLLSSKIFNSNNEEVSKEWERLKLTLSIL